MVSVLVSFARLLEKNGYTTSMWDSGYEPGDVNEVCHHLTEWCQSELGLTGEFIVVWAQGDGTTFMGDSELAYLVDDKAYLLPNPFIEGDSEGFVVSLHTIMDGALRELYETPIRQRVLYNAI